MFDPGDFDMNWRSKRDVQSQILVRNNSVDLRGRFLLGLINFSADTRSVSTLIKTAM